METQEIDISFLEKLQSNDYLIWFIALWMFLLVAYKVLNGSYRTIKDAFMEPGISPLQKYELGESKESVGMAKGIVLVLLLTVPFFYFLYVGVSGTSNSGFVMEWFNLMVRWAHVVAGVMWIGASFYFIFLENNLNRTNDVRDELAGNLWAIHGGGFYFLEKYKVAPKLIPKDLHWFKYEAYFTWLTGFALLIIVYYMDAQAFLVDSNVADISSEMGIVIGISTLVVGWVIYDIMCRSVLIRKQGLFALVGLLFLAVIAYFLTQTMNPRAAFIHVGALLGTIMAWNVFFVIIPSQKALVKAALTGNEVDASLGKKAGGRSLHNNYITLPVIFIMISNHFPSTFGHQFNWIILLVITIASAGIKHYWNLVERGVVKRYIMIVSLLGFLLIAFLSSPIMEDAVDNSIPTSFEEADVVMKKHCVQCHSSSPTDEVWKKAPNGVMFDTPDQIKNMADKIMTRAVRTTSMPQGNKTKMTTDERMVLKRWILQGAKTNEP